MKWTQVSPGIWKGNHGGFTITKLQDKASWTGRIIAGKKEMAYQYQYIAIKPGPPAPVRYAGNNLDKILTCIASLLQPSLFV